MIIFILRNSTWTLKIYLIYLFIMLHFALPSWTYLQNIIIISLSAIRNDSITFGSFSINYFMSWLQLIFLWFFACLVVFNCMENTVGFIRLVTEFWRNIYILDVLDLVLAQSEASGDQLNRIYYMLLGFNF